MILFPDLLQLPHQLRHPEVRDLAWVILAPPMLAATPWPQRHPLAGSDWVSDPERLEHWLRQLDRDLNAHGLNGHDYEILVELSEAPDQRLRMTELADATAPNTRRLAAATYALPGPQILSTAAIASSTELTVSAFCAASGSLRSTITDRYVADRSVSITASASTLSNPPRPAA